MHKNLTFSSLFFDYLLGIILCAKGSLCLLEFHPHNDHKSVKVIEEERGLELHWHSSLGRIWLKCSSHQTQGVNHTFRIYPRNAASHCPEWLIFFPPFKKINFSFRKVSWSSTSTTNTSGITIIYFPRGT